MKKRMLSVVLALVLLVGLLPTVALAEDPTASRGFFLTELARTADVTGVERPAVFSDVGPSDPCAPYLAWAVENHIAAGDSSGHFRPDAALTREQAAVMAANYLVSLGYLRGTAESAAGIYNDGGRICAWATTSVAMLTRLGILQGGTDGAFAPDAALTKSQTATLLANLTQFLTTDAALTEQAQKLCEEMTLDEKIGQVLTVDLRSWKDAGKSTVTGMEVLSEEVKDILATYHLGSIVLFGENVKTTAGTVKLTADLQRAATEAGDPPLLICIDQEGGRVTRLGQGTCLPGNMALGATGDPRYAYEAARVIGEELAALGIACNLAPDCDVNDNPLNPVIGLRSFGADPTAVAAMARQYLAGLESTGTIGCAKHFPGHGNTATDTHSGLALVSRTKAEWLATDAVPFQALIASGIDMVMSSHIQNPNLDSTKLVSQTTGEEIYLPASLSRAMLTDLLRGELGFDGVVCSDAMTMGAITSHFGEAQAAVMALQAGSNLLCNASTLTSLADLPRLDAIYTAIRAAVTDGSLPQAQLDDSVIRVLKLKLESGLFDQTALSPEAQLKQATDTVGSAAHRATERTIAEAAVTLYGGSDIPMQLKAGEKVLFVVAYENEAPSVRFAVNRLKKEGTVPNITVETACYQEETQLSAKLAAQIKAADHVVVFSELGAATSADSAHWSNAMPQKILAAAVESGKTDSAVISLGLPYDATSFPGVPVYLVYGSVGMSEKDAASGVITGKYGPNIAAGIGCALGTFAPTGTLPVQPVAQSEIKNVILMISDGTSVGVSALTRWYNAYDSKTGLFDTDVRLNVDPLTSGLVRTYWENAAGIPGAITDSAPGSTAISTGYKTNDKYVGVGPDGTPHATVLELAESLGKSTGLAVTVNVQHATPADFAAHTTNRNDYELIAAQMLQAGVDVVLGGGSKYMQNRADGRDLIAELKGDGYEYLTTASELASCENQKVYGLFAPDAMAYELDRPLTAPEQPTLAEMTGKAISLLSQNEKGFFLMVEGSKVDWGAHNNDPAAVVSEFRAFDQAVEEAVTFAQGRSDTMILILEDHGTGGISIGSSLSDSTYSSYPLANIIPPLVGAQVTGYGVMELLSQGKSAEEALAQYGVKDPTAEELQQVRAMTPDLNAVTSDDLAVLGRMLSRRCNIGWTTLGHTGEDVVLYSYLPGDERITGLIENTDITRAIADAWGVPLTDAACKHP